MIRAFLIIFIFLSLPFFVPARFKLPPVHPDLPPYNPAWEINISKEVRSILGQKFTFFSQGNQSYVFLSEDGRYVLKLFRYTRSQFPFIHKTKNFFKKNPKMDIFTKIEKTLAAAYLGATKAKSFTEAVYAHLNLTENLLPRTTLIVGKRTYQIPMDRYRFCIQKKVTPFKEAFLNARQDALLVQKQMESFGELLLERSFLNIRNTDPNLGPNFGFLDGKAVEIDFGNYSLAEDKNSFQIKEFNNLMNRFEDWVEKTMPEHLVFLKGLRLKFLQDYDAILDERTRNPS